MIYKNVLTIAGSDPSGGAGIQADLKTFTALGVYGAAAITALTVQNTQKVYDSLALEPRFVEDQVKAVLDDIKVDYIKTGMLANADIAKAVGGYLDEIFVVCDPVMISKSGYPLLEDRAVKAIREHVIPKSDILTPNYHELLKLTGGKIKDAVEAGYSLMEEIPSLKALLVKGGHVDEEKDEVEDVLIVRELNGLRNTAYTHPRYITEHLHGTGCTLASAITAYLARNNDLSHAVEMGIDYVTSLIKISQAGGIGRGNGPLYHHAGMKL